MTEKSYTYKVRCACMGLHDTRANIIVDSEFSNLEDAQEHYLHLKIRVSPNRVVLEETPYGYDYDLGMNFGSIVLSESWRLHIISITEIINYPNPTKP